MRTRALRSQSWSTPPSRISIRYPTARAISEPASTLLRSATDRGAHQLHAIGARPIGGACHVADLAAGGIDDQRGRHAERSSGDFQLLEHLGAVVGKIGEVVNADLTQEGVRFFRI